MKWAHDAGEQSAAAGWDWPGFRTAMESILAKSSPTQQNIRNMFRILDKQYSGRIMWKDWMTVVESYAALDAKHASDAFRGLSRGHGALSGAKFVDLMLEETAPYPNDAQCMNTSRGT